MNEHRNGPFEIRADGSFDLAHFVRRQGILTQDMPVDHEKSDLNLLAFFNNLTLFFSYR
jgi:hypothetical protein